MNSPFAWPGGKRALKSTLLSLIPKHDIYVEVFAGSAKLLFAKEPSRVEVINDMNGELMNFFRIAKHRPAELAERLDFEIVHAGRFRELRGMELRAGTSCEIDRALRFAYLVWYSFGAKGEHFASTSAKSPKMRRPLDRVRETFSGIPRSACLLCLSSSETSHRSSIVTIPARRSFILIRRMCASSPMVAMSR